MILSHYIFGGIVLAILLIWLFAKLLFKKLGIEDLRVEADAPFVVTDRDEKSITLSKKLHFHNEGNSCATIMDALLRPQLPYEQYDGVEARGKAEREGEEREDDYFEAVILQKKGYVRHEDELNVYAILRLTARKGGTIGEALKDMAERNVDLGMDFIWMETGRRPWHYRKLRLNIGADEWNRIAGEKPQAK